MDNRKKERLKNFYENLLLWEPASPEVTYSWKGNQNAELDIARFIEQLPYWKEIKTGSISRPKKLIITDWSNKYLNETFDNELWSQIMSEGKKFGNEIFVWTGKLTKVNNIHELKKEIRNVELISSKELSAKLLSGKPKIAQDESEIIDFVIAQQLASELLQIQLSRTKNHDKPCLNLQSISAQEISPGTLQSLVRSIHSKVNFEILITNFEQADLLITALNFSQQANSLQIGNLQQHELDELLNKLEANQKRYEMIKSLRVICTINNAQQLARLLNIFPNIENLQLGTSHLQANDPNLTLKVDKLKRLRLHNSHLSAEVHNKLISSAPQLEILHVNNCTTPGSFALPSLKKLSLTMVDLTDERLLEALDHCELSELILSLVALPDCHGIKTLKNLKNVKLKLRTNLHLNSLLSKAPNIELLNIHSEQYTSFSDCTPQLLKLKTLNLANQKDIEIQSLVKNFPSLTNIEINCSQFQESLNKDINSNSALNNKAQIILKYSNFKKDELAALLRQFSNIKFEHSENFLLSASSEQFDHVESLQFVACDIDDITLGKIVARCPNLKKLYLNDCRNSTGFFLTQHQLNQLTDITILGDSRVTSKSDLNDILSKAPNLRDIHFNQLDESILDLETLKNHSRLKIKVNRFTSKTINDEKLKQFLRCCRGISDLNLADNPNINGSFHGETTDFSELVSLNLSNTNVTAFNLGNLLAQLPSLQSLELKSCKNLFQNKETIDLFIQSFNSALSQSKSAQLKLKTIDLSNTIVDKELVKCLIKFSPNLSCLALENTKLTPEDCVEFKKLRSNMMIIGIDYEDRYYEVVENENNVRASVSLPAKQHTPDSYKFDSQHKLQFDACTGLSNTPLVARQIFIGKFANPHPANYRINVNAKLKVGSKIEFQDVPVVIKELKSFPAHQNVAAQFKNGYFANPKVFFADVELPLNDSEWYPLPSLSSEDEMLNLSADIPLRLGYCEAESRYYVKPLEPIGKADVRVNFIIKSNPIETEKPNKKTQDKAKSLFKEIHFTADGKIVLDENFKKIQQLSPEKQLEYLVAFCHSFGEENLKTKTKDDLEKLNAIINETQGACRHRTWAFMAIAEQLGIQARAITNDIHAFVEVYWDKKWIKKDLGGHPAQLTIKPIPPKPKPKIPSPIPAKESKQESRLQIHKVQPSTEASLSPDNPFITWDTVKSDAKTFKAYFDSIIQKAEMLPPNQRNLLFMVAPEQMELFHEHVTQYFKDCKRNTYYLNSLDDVSERTAHIETDGSLKKVDSTLVKFVKDAKTGDALISNWSDYKAAFVGYNAMMDEERKIKTLPIREGTLVISVLDKTKADRLGEDFYSRFRIKSECINLNDSHLREKLLLSNEDVGKFTEVEFFDNDWKKNLLGKIAINGESFQIEKAKLIDAINNKSAGILLINAPWHLSEFRLFIAELMIKRKVSFNGIEINLPDHFQIKEMQKQYDLSKEQLNIVYTNTEAKTDYHLNSETLGNFYKTLRCKNNLLYTDNGWLKENTSKTISLFVTETLSIQQWTQLLSEAKNVKCNLELKLAPNICIPTIDMAKVPIIEDVASENTNLILTDDLEYAEEIIFKDYPQATSISVNEKNTFSDIIGKINPIDHSFNWIFENIEADIWKKLEKGETVILKGKLSSTLAKQIETLFNKPPYIWINGEKKYSKGNLIFITDGNDPFPHLSKQQLLVTQDKCWELLEKNEFNSNNKEEFNPNHQELFFEFKKLCEQMQVQGEINFKYGQLRAMFEKLKAGNFSNPFKPFLRLNPGQKSILAKHIWQSKKIAKPWFNDVIEKRQHRIISEFKTSPYLFIAGSSGVGKSTHILEELSKDPIYPCKVFVGIEEIKNWLCDPNDKQHVLFIDEANIEEDGTWDILEGLFNKTPGILLDGVFYPLSTNHKVIFAGNYNYFAGRHEHQFFERHGQVYNFKELPEEYITQKVIKPAIHMAMPNLQNDEVDIIAQKFLQIYTDANAYYDNHPATLRNLKMMALRLSIYMDEHKDAALNKTFNLAQLASFAAVDELKGVIQNIDPFLKAFSLKKLDLDVSNVLEAQIPPQINDFIVTDSRKRALRCLQDLFMLRENQITNPSLSKTTLPGFLIEGAAGIGKSKMVTAYLNSLGFQKGNETEPNENPTKCYYHITPTDPEKMERILLKAFHEGAVVIIDELNSLPLERIINQLLSGQDLQGNKAKNKGFCLICTQNPATFAGRQVLSEALENRFNKIFLNDYPENELRYIANKICPDKEIANQIVSEYLHAKKYAQKHQKSPEPTPRDLFQYLAKIAKDLRQKDEIPIGKQEITPDKLQKSTQEPMPVKNKTKTDEWPLVATEIKEEFLAGLNTILKEIKNHHYILHGGGVPVYEDEELKYYSRSALYIKNLVEANLKVKHPTHQTFYRLRANIEVELLGKFVKKRGFLFNFGGRDETTVDLYHKIIKHLNDTENSLKQIKEVRPSNDSSFDLNTYCFSQKISRFSN